MVGRWLCLARLTPAPARDTQLSPSAAAVAAAIAILFITTSQFFPRRFAPAPTGWMSIADRAMKESWPNRASAGMKKVGLGRRFDSR